MPEQQRDGFLDVVRALATVRVVLWHAFGAAWLTFVAAMPAMFFVTGSLYAKSVDRHGARATLVDRLRRIGPSLWLFAGFAWVAMAIGAHLSGTDLHVRNLAFWIVPIGDPAGSPWEGGWLATPLWYLRTLLWLFLLAPLVIRSVRRWPLATLLLSVAAVVVLEIVDRSGLWRPPVAERALWQVGDVVLYGTFFAVGVLAHDGAFSAVRRSHWIAVAAAAALAGALWWWTQPVPEGVVNNSHAMHLAVGVTWLALAMAARPLLRQGTVNRATAPIVRFLSRRSLTVYLWHTTAIVVALWFVRRAAELPPGAWMATYLVLIVACTVLATVAFGWLEDLAAKRSPSLWPLPPPTDRAHRVRWAPVVAPLAAVAAIALALPTAPADQHVAFRPPVPSQAPPRPEFGLPQPIELAEIDPTIGMVTWLDHAALQQLVDEWLAEHRIPGASVAVAAPDGDTFATARGAHLDLTPRSLADQLDVMSITKVFTANLVYRAADAGLIDLDAPLPPLAREPDFPFSDRVTPRQLLAHTTGIVNYRDTTRYALDRSSITNVSDAISSSVAEGLVVEPGTATIYSSTNYLVLGRLLEQVTGVDYEELLFRELLLPLGLASAGHLPPDVGEPRYATAGLVADVADLARAGIALLRDHVGISAEAYQTMLEIDVDSGMGPGVNGYCPCTRDIDGNVDWFGIGYTGGNTLLLYVPDADVAVAIDVTEGLYGDPGHFDAVMELARRIATLVTLQQTTAGPA